MSLTPIITVTHDPKALSWEFSITIVKAPITGPG